MAASEDTASRFDRRLRGYIYKHLIARGRAPSRKEMASGLSCRVARVKQGLQRLAATHAFVLQENGELWRAAPFSAVPTAFSVRARRRAWYGNCIWDALGIPAMLDQDATVEASCGCCNYEMRLEVKQGKLLGTKGVIHFAVPARDWYRDIVFT